MLYAFISKSDRVTRKPTKKMVVADNDTSLAAKVTSEIRKSTGAGLRNGYGPITFNIEVGRVSDE